MVHMRNTYGYWFIHECFQQFVYIGSSCLGLHWYGICMAFGERCVRCIAFAKGPRNDSGIIFVMFAQE